MNQLNKDKTVNTHLWKRIAIIAGTFCILVSALLIMNYIQYNRMDPVNVKVIDQLVERLSENPSDEALRQQIRELDLLARKAYFTNQWQVRTGGYLLLIGFAVLIIALQILNSRKKISPDVSELKPENIFFTQKNARKWLAISGAALISTALFFAYLTHHQLSEQFHKGILAEKSEKEIISEEQIEEPAIETEEEVVVAETKVSIEETKEDIPLPEGKTVTNTEIKKTPKAEKKEAPPKVKPTINNFATFRGKNGQGIAYNTNIPTKWDGTTGENIKWKTLIPLHGYNSPIVWGDKVFLSGANAEKKEIYCFNGNTGTILWTANTTGVQGSKGAPEVTDDTGHSAPTLATDGKRIYGIFSNGDVIALDMNGKMVWGKNLGLPENHYGHSSSLIIYKEKLIVQFDDRKEAKLLALNAKTGAQLWRTIRNVKISWASPVIINSENRDEIILAADPFVSSYDPETGKELWKLDCISGEVGPSVGYADGIVFSVNEYSKLAAIKVTGTTPEIIWEDEEYLSDVPSPVATADLLFLPTSWGAVVCYEAKTGTKLWEQEYDYGFYSSPILAEDKVYMIDRAGVMHIVKAGKTFELVSSNPLGEKTDCTPAFADGRIYIRGEKNLYCIGK